MEAQIENDKKIPIDIRTSKIFLEIANSVSFLKLTVDSPSLHPSGFMPILDLENNQIIYKFYKKEVSNNLVILNKSAMPIKVKRITYIQREILTEFSWSLHQSGNPEQSGGDFQWDSGLRDTVCQGRCWSHSNP